MKIPVCYITDDNYVMPTVVSAYSLLKNAVCDYEIYVIGVDLSPASKKNLSKIQKIRLLEFENKYENFKINKTYVTKAAFFKFDLPEIFSGLEKIIFLDSDTLILKDLSPLFEINLENFYAAAVKDCIGELTQNYLEKLCLNDYFYSGAMLLNLEKMRKNNITQKLCDTKQNSPTNYLDQEIFNLVFKDNVKFLHPDFNFVPPSGILRLKTIKNFYNTNKIDPIILHCTWQKPWNYSNVPNSKIWMKYFKEIFKNQNLKRKHAPTPLFKKRKFNDRWVIDFFILRVSYKKGGKDIKFFYP